MNTENILNLIAEDLQLGRVVEEPVRVTGGFMHRMFKVVTEKGKTFMQLLSCRVLLS